MPLVMRIKRIHHLTVAVRDAERARSTFEALFEAASGEPETIDAFGVRARDISVGDGVVQLAAPLGPDTPVMRFIERKGEGFYNLALEVDDLDACLAELAERGIRVSEPIEATPGLRSSFVTMTATHGLSIQLVQPVDPSADTDETSPAEVVASDDLAIEQGPLDLTPDEWSDTD
jgi:methylmalonyl-CoA epimerase